VARFPVVIAVENGTARTKEEQASTEAGKRPAEEVSEAPVLIDVRPEPLVETGWFKGYKPDGEGRRTGYEQDVGRRSPCMVFDQLRLSAGGRRYRPLPSVQNRHGWRRS
jgi:hypothetical protein